MSLPAYLAARAALGGTLVVVFALIGEVVKPKRFAGLFGAAPSVALANLGLVVIVQGTPTAVLESKAMIGGAVAMIVACAVGIVSVRRWHAIRGTVAMAVAWLAAAAVAGVLY